MLQGLWHALAAEQPESVVSRKRQLFIALSVGKHTKTIIMETEEINMILQIAILIGGLYLIFFKSYFKEKGKNLATMEDIGEITREVEEVKSLIQKQNIAYQINFSELTKRRYDRIDNLYVDLVNLQNFVKQNMFFYNDEADFNFKIEEFRKFYDLADTSRHKCSLYISTELKQKIIDVLNGAYSAYMSFRGLYNTDTRKLGEVSIFNVQKQQLMHDLTTKNMNHLQALSDKIDKFPELLNGLEEEFKKQVILKEIER